MNYLILFFFIIGIFIYNLFCKKDIIEGINLLYIPSKALFKILDIKISYYDNTYNNNILISKLKDKGEFVAEFRNQGNMNLIGVGAISRTGLPSVITFKDAYLSQIPLLNEFTLYPLESSYIESGYESYINVSNDQGASQRFNLANIPNNGKEGIYTFVLDDQDGNYIKIKLLSYLNVDKKINLVNNNKAKIKQYIYSQFIE